MFLNLGIILNAVLFAVGVLWCREMWSRWRRDLDEYRSTKDASTRQTLAILWGVTAVIAILLVNFLVGILKNLGVL